MTPAVKARHSSGVKISAGPPGSAVPHRDHMVAAFLGAPATTATSMQEPSSPPPCEGLRHAAPVRSIPIAFLVQVDSHPLARIHSSPRLTAVILAGTPYGRLTLRRGLVSGYPRFRRLAAGSQLAGYTIEEQIGRGGMAVVYRASDRRLNRPVALKILAPELASDEAYRQRFLREMRAAAAVDHPNIVPVFDAGEADGALFIAMRYVDRTCARCSRPSTGCRPGRSSHRPGRVRARRGALPRPGAP